MVRAVRGGESQRTVAQRYGVSLGTVQRWVARAAGLRFDRVDWTDHRQRPRRAPNRTAPALEDQVLRLRDQLGHSVLGEVGAVAIHSALVGEGGAAPCVRTIGR